MAKTRSELLVYFLPRAIVESQGVTQQHGTKSALTLECLEQPACVRALVIILVEAGHQNGELGLVRGEGRLAPFAAQVGDVAVQRLRQVVQRGGDISRGYGAEDTEQPHHWALD
jgi:hypothetical protein